MLFIRGSEMIMGFARHRSEHDFDEHVPARCLTGTAAIA